jgi:hypothetical protein
VRSDPRPYVPNCGRSQFFVVVEVSSVSLFLDRSCSQNGMIFFRHNHSPPDVSVMESQKAPDMSETASITSEVSAAVVSVYISWSSASESSSLIQDDDDDCLEIVDSRFVELLDTPVRPEELLESLRKRCREENLPPVPELRRRKKPNCRFLNYMGATRLSAKPNCRFLNYMGVTRLPAMAEKPERPPSTTGMDFDLEDTDDLYPLCSQKALHDIDREDEEGLVRASLSDDELTLGSRHVCRDLSYY